MTEKAKPAIGSDEMERIRSAFKRAEERAAAGPARRERRMEDIYHGDVPTFMELPLAKRPEDLNGADAAILGFGYEGITAKSPTLSAPPTVSRPPANSVYWRMGADNAPEAIRKYSLYYSIHHNRGYYPEIDKDLVLLDHLTVRDYGDVDVVPEDTTETLRRAEEKVSHILDAGAAPVILGGDHTTPIPVLRAISKKIARPMGLVSFDSHLDLSDTPECWGSVQWAKTFELGKVDPKNFVFIGIRSNRNTIFERHVAEELGIRFFTIDEVKRIGMNEVVAEAVRLATEGTDGIYVSVDIDVMEPSLVPSQKAPEIWGLTVDEMMTALRALAREKLLGYDVCEMTPDYDVNGLGAQFCARTVVEILAGLAIRKRSSS
jgi:arginase family enzyme